jgi:threonine synthase
MFHYQCTECDRTYQNGEVTYLCPRCAEKYVPGNPLRGVLRVCFDYEYIGKRFSIDSPDYQLFSTIDAKYYPEYPVGDTPFHRSERLGARLGFTNVWIKNDGLNPSGSLKDRASFLMVAEANRRGMDTIVTASTGNAASALAAVCASAGKRAVIFVPDSAPKAKLVQIMLCGARVIPVAGTYDDAFRLSIEYSERRGGLNRNTAYHPLTIEGKKTAGFEIFQQNECRVPDAIIIPVGDGVIIAGIYKAFYDLKSAGLISTLPKLVCVQADRSSAIHDFVQSGQYRNAVSPDTVADSISVSAPANAYMARNAVVNTDGFSLAVTDEEMLDAQALLASTTGVFAEPSAAAVVAGLKKIRQDEKLQRDDQIVLLITGHGLKDIDTPLKGMKMPASVTSIDQIE